MRISDLREEMGLSLAEFAVRLGLTSKSHVHEIEAKNQCSVAVALEIERISEGRIPANTINADVERVRNADTAA